MRFNEATIESTAAQSLARPLRSRRVIGWQLPADCETATPPVQLNSIVWNGTGV
jgi:hypothetical protein